MISFQDLNIYQGDSFSMGITVKDDNNIPMNLSGYLARALIKERYSSTGIASLDCLFTQANSGILTLSLPSSGTANLPINQLLYDVEVYNTAETDVFKVLKGYINVYPEVTN